MFPRPPWPLPPLGPPPAPPAFPQPPSWWTPGAAPPSIAGGKGDGRSGKGKGGQRGKGSRGAGGNRGRRGSGTSDETQGFYNPSFVENPWRDLIPNEPAVFAYCGSASACASASPSLVPAVPSIKSNLFGHHSIPFGEASRATQSTHAPRLTGQRTSSSVRHNALPGTMSRHLVG